MPVGQGRSSQDLLDDLGERILRSPPWTFTCPSYARLLSPRVMTGMGIVLSHDDGDSAISSVTKQLPGQASHSTSLGLSSGAPGRK